MATDTVTGKSVAGARGGTAVAPSVVLVVIPDATTTAHLGTGAEVTATGAVEVAASYTLTVAAETDARSAGSDVSVGASIAVNVLLPTTTASTARSLAGSAVTVGATSNVSVTADAFASAKGNSPSGESADSEADGQVQNTAATQGKAGTLPSSNEQTSNASSTSSAESGQGSSGTGVAASIAFNWVDVTNSATVAANRSLIGSAGEVAVSALAHTDASAKAIGVAVDMSNSTNVGAGVGFNYLDVDNLATVGAGATLRGVGVRVEAVTPAGQSNDVVAWGLSSAGGAQSDTSVAGSAAVNVVLLTFEATIGSGSTIGSTAGLTVAASAPLGIQALALAGAFGTGTSVGASVAVDVAILSVGATVEDNVRIDVAGATAVTATSGIAPLDVFATDIPILGNVKVTSVAVGAAVSSGDVAVGGSVVVDVFTVDTRATLGANTVVNQGVAGGAGQTISIAASHTLDVRSGAGGLGGALGTAGVGAGIVVQVVTQTVRAGVGAGSRVSAGGDISITADSRESSGHRGLGRRGSRNGRGLGVHRRGRPDRGHRRPRAQHPGGTDQRPGRRQLTISASDDARDISLAAGGLAFGSSAGVGVSSVVLVKTTTVLAVVGSRPRRRPGAPGRTRRSRRGLHRADRPAVQAANLLLIAIAGGGAGTAGVAGSVTVNVTTHTTIAQLGAGTSVNWPRRAPSPGSP